MNANELADALQETEPYYSTDYKLFDKAATMLRQQQEQIEALKDGIEKLKDGIEKLKDAYCQKDGEVKKLKGEAKKAEQFYLDAFDRGKQIGYAEGMIGRKAQEK